ncbi:zinc-binding alcohol dehydrogenase family protein [Embleya sp. NPDC050493]|uniref:zinc-binding alcohol dehydrogenase family protein n=1 Tax=Embleya sp. NPDC050493 TaxID=3363989 RepID=UPI00379CA8FF
MRRVRYHEYGDPDVLTVEEVDRPAPGPGQVLVRVEEIGANFVDTRFRLGPAAGPLFRRPLPGVLTGDVVGVIEAVGPEVTQWHVGRRVAGLAEDAFADFVVADAEWLVEVPDGLDAGAAGALPMAAPVALRALRTGRLAVGETVLVHAAAGGIGHLAVQLATLLGAGTVIGTAGSADKLAFVKEYGADFAIDYTDPDWPARVREVAPQGVDVVLDSVGGEILRRSFDVLAPLGRIAVYGAASGELVAIPVTDLFALRSVTGFSLLAWRAASPAEARRDMVESADHLGSGRLRVAVHARLPLTAAAEAHRVLDARGQSGRVVLVP